MTNKSIANTIYNRISLHPKCTIFINSDFYDLGSRKSIEMALSRLSNNNDIYRLIDGFYTIPYYSKTISEYSYPTVEQLANKIADKFSWSICPYGETALNIVGLSTQVSNNYEYISDGPYRKYYYRGKEINFKHTTNRSISLFSKELSIVIQAIKALEKDKITNMDIQRISNYCRKYVKEDILQDTKKIPAWIYEILKQVSEVEYNE